MKRNLFATFAGVGLGAMLIAAPTSAMANDHNRDEWRNIGLASAAVGLIGLANHDSKLATIGFLGAGYSAYRYDAARHCYVPVDRHPVYVVRDRDDWRWRDRDDHWRDRDGHWRDRDDRWRDRDDHRRDWDDRHGRDRDDHWCDRR